MAASTRALWLVALGGLVVWVVRRRRHSGSEGRQRVSIGFADGSSTTLEDGSPERELLVAVAAGV